jgi:2-phosphosulfolactate phosphatase
LPPKVVAIDCLAECSKQYDKETAIVVIDVIRSTTVAATVVESGRRCFFAPTTEAAILLKHRLYKPLLVGEVGGNMPYGFDFKNSPVDVKKYPDKSRPVIIVSTSGIPLLYSSKNCGSVLVACLRDYSATVKHLARHYNNVKLLGAPTRGEFREEDKLCCAWIAAGLIEAGFTCADAKTLQLVNNWKIKPVTVCGEGNSARYLIETRQKKDLNFILKHVDDLNYALIVEGDEIIKAST